MRFQSLLRFLPGSRAKRRPARVRPNSSRLAVELLERRELLAGNVPTIDAVGVQPVDGSTASTGLPILQVKFSEKMTSSVLTPSNYILVGTAGVRVPIDSVQFTDDPLNTTVRIRY